MEEYKILYSNDAIDDLRTIFHYYMSRTSNASFANIVLSHIYKACDELSYFPSKYPLVSWPVWNKRGIRKKLYDKYYIFYIVDELKLQVTITKIINTRQNVTHMVCEPVSHYNK